MRRLAPQAEQKVFYGDTQTEVLIRLNNYLRSKVETHVLVTAQFIAAGPAPDGHPEGQVWASFFIVHRERSG